MPELPEVEHIARSLRRGGRGHDGVVGLKLEMFSVVCPKLRIGGRADLVPRLASAGLVDVDRRGKYLRLRFSEADIVLHLRMTGDVIVVDPETTESPRHERLQLKLSNGRNLVLDDPRRLAEVWVVDEGAWPRADIADDPLEPSWSPSELHWRLGSLRRPLKIALLDQTVISGLGNIWVDETLHRAKIHPSRITCSLSLEEARQLLEAARTVLQSAIIDLEHAGLVWAHRGGFRGPLPGRVYGRGGGPCPDCGASLHSLRIGGRTTTVCDGCQPLR
jgi:formamidopyrimidine-DNA glycosylase